jgi:GDP-D-mannose dehydratase
MSKRILIVGAGGQDGTILRKHIHKNDIVFSVSRTSSSVNNNTRHEGPGFSPSSIPELNAQIISFAPELVYYLPTIHGSDGSHVNTDESRYLERKFIDQVGLQLLIESLMSLRSPVSFLYASSSKIFGNHIGPANEETPTDPQCEYSRSKLSAMSFLESINSTHLKIISCVLFHHHSEYRKGQFALNLIAENLATRSDAMCDGFIRDWNAVGDFSCAHAVCALMHQLHEIRFHGRVVIGSGILRNLRDIYNELCIALGKPDLIHGTSMGSVRQGIFAASSRLERNGLRLSDNLIRTLTNQVRVIRNESKLA